MKGNKKLLALASAALLLGACAQETVLTPDEARELDPKSNEISFGTYMGKNSQTRAGDTGPIDNTALQSKGFGVFAYYTGATDYAAGQTSTGPNFMYNQKVSYDGSSSSWSYSPVKYWPNDISTADGGNVDNQTSPAQGSAGGGKVSFFAYAPYVGTYTPAGGSENTFNPSTGKWATDETTGITGFSANTATSDPTLTFVVNGVDLLWGTADNTDPNVLGTVQTGTILTNGKGAVNANLTKQKTDGKVKFLFKHALASISDIKVLLDIDHNGIISGGTKPEDTKVTINSLEIKGKSGTVTNTSGVLNLATGAWTSASPVVTGNPVDGRVDKTSETTLWEPTTTPSSWNDVPAGVTATAVANAHVIGSLNQTLIPGTSATYIITIEYIVRTKDTNLSKGFSEVSQKIKKEVTIAAPSEINKKVTLLLHLGLTSVKFDATVGAWDETGTGASVEDHLPVNVATTP